MTTRPRYVIFGSGDKGTAELRDLMFQKRVPIDFRDIRELNADDKREHLIDFVKLQAVFPDMEHSVPQVFWVGPDENEKAVLIGNFEQTERHLKMAFSFGDAAVA